MSKMKFTIILLILFPMAVGLACLRSAPDPTATPAEQGMGSTDEVGAPTRQSIGVPVEETPPPVLGEFQELYLLDNDFWVQEEGTVFLSFIFKNDNPDVVFEEIEYTISLYDANNIEIDNQTGTINWIYPNQAFGVATKIYLEDETATVDSISINWVSKDNPMPDGLSSPLTILGPKYWPGTSFPIVTGLIENNSSDLYTSFRLNILCFNSSGAIIGGGYTYVDFIKGEGEIGFSTFVDVYDDVASIEVYPDIPAVQTPVEDVSFWSNISIVDHYFYEGTYDNILGGMVIKNETMSVLENSTLFITFFDDPDNVTTTGYSYISVLLPGESLGVSPYIAFPPTDSNSTNYVFYILPGQPADDYPLAANPFTVNSTTLTGDFNEYVAVSFTNNGTLQVSEVDVYVLVYDAEGTIIGGGSGYTSEPTSAGGTSEIEVWVDYSESYTVERIEAWVTPNFWTEFD